jgi:hypothetical protein
MIPTMSLRFVERPAPIPGTCMVDTVIKVRVLQQRFDTITNGMRWIDVPCITEPQTGSEP